MKKKKECNHTTKPGNVWHFLWHDDSMLSFAVDIILILIIGKFILYPSIGAVFGTEFPIVAVISGSMDHHGQDLDDWWSEMGNWYEDKGITKEMFQGYYSNNGFKKGDVLIIKGRTLAELEVGDVIVYSTNTRPEPIIHRIVDNPEGSVVTKGDANQAQLNFELDVKEEQIHGEAILLVPKIGWVKVIFVELLNLIRR